MSSSPSRVALPRAPSAARASAGTLDEHLGALLARERELGRAEGRAEGSAAAQREAAGALEAARERLDAARETAQAELCGPALDLALLVARALVRSEVAAGRHAVERIVRETLARSGAGRGPCAVHVHPADAKALEGLAFRAGTEIVPDPAVDRGSAQVATAHGLLVHDWEDALRAIEARLRAELS